MSLPFRDRPFIGDALDFHRRDAQHDAAGWVPDDVLRCPECRQRLADDYCPYCRVFVDVPNETDDILNADFNLAGAEWINEVW